MEVREIRLEELRKEIQKGVVQLERSEYRSYETEDLEMLISEVKQQGRAKKNSAKSD